MNRLLDACRAYSHLFALILLLAVFLACASEIGRRAEVQYVQEGFDAEELRAGGLACLPIAGGQPGNRQILSASLDNTIQSLDPDLDYLPARRTAEVLNDADMVETYQDAIVKYQASGIADKKVLQAIGKALNHRYLFLITLGDFKEEKDTRESFLSGEVESYDSKKARALGQLWDGTSQAASSDTDFTTIEATEDEFHEVAGEVLARSLLGKPMK